MKKDYPIVLGHQFRKGILALRDKGDGFKFLICRLKKEYPTGDRFDLKDVKSIEHEIWVADRDTLETIIKVMKEALEIWNC